MFENPFRDTVAIHPRLSFCDGKFAAGFYEGDTEVDPLKYLNKKCSVRLVISPEYILVGTRVTTLQLKAWEVEVLELEGSVKNFSPRKTS